MTHSETPESILDFFASLDSDGQDNGHDCQIHYGCACVLRKGRIASEMLVALIGQQTVSTSEPPAPPQDDAALQALSEELAAEKAKSEGLLQQNLKLANENIQLKSKIQALQRQVNRLYDTLELKSIQQDMRRQESPSSQSAETAAPAALPQEILQESAARVVDKTPPPAAGPVAAPADLASEENAAGQPPAEPPAAKE